MVGTTQSVKVKAVGQSKVVWLNTVVLVLSIVFAVAEGLNLIEPVPSEYSGAVSATIAVLNVVLRIFATKAPVVFR